MGDPREFWIVDENDETILLIEERQQCPVDRVELDGDGVCPECELNWTVFS
jgi:hypothetical protein